MSPRIGLAYNPTIDAALELRERAAGWLQLRGIDHWVAAAGDFDTLVKELPTTDALIVLGGDGTFLRAARATAEVDVPLLGVNLGKVGFLSKIEANQLEAVLAQLVAGEYSIDPRMAARASVYPGGSETPPETFIALNDVVVARGTLARVVPAGRRDRLVAPRDVHRGRAGRVHAHRAPRATRSRPAARSSTRSAAT